MTDRDRLIELLNNWGTENNDGIRAESVADYLIVNGAILLPCNVGDIVYAVGDKDGHQIKECRVSCFDFESAEHFVAEVYFDCDYCNCTVGSCLLY